MLDLCKVRVAPNPIPPSLTEAKFGVLWLLEEATPRTLGSCLPLLLALASTVNVKILQDECFWLQDAAQHEEPVLILCQHNMMLGDPASHSPAQTEEQITEGQGVCDDAAQLLLCALRVTLHSSQEHTRQHPWPKCPCAPVVCLCGPQRWLNFNEAFFFKMKGAV